MNCQKFAQVAGDLARGRMMEAEVRTEALTHSEECDVCLARLRDEVTLTRGLQMLSAETSSLSAPPELEQKLREAFRQRQVVVAMPVRSARPRYWWVAVAAVLVVAMTAAMMWWRSAVAEQNVAKEALPKQVEAPQVPGESAPKETQYQAENDAPKQPAPSNQVEAPQVPRESAPKEVQYQAKNEPSKQQAPSPRQIHRSTTPRRAPETPMANHVTNEIATDFMPLGDPNPAALQDGGQIVRVKLRRSALVRFGFPVNMDRYNENVKADVLVGVDGLAHAIRFVQ